MSEERRDDKKVSLRPLSFEEALADLLQVKPPPKDAAPVPESEREPAKEPPHRKHHRKQDKEKGSQ